MREKILIVEDRASSQMKLERLLQSHYDVISAEDGDRAIEIANAQVPDAILLDTIMRGLDGFEVLRRLQANEKTAAIPVLFVTGLFHPDDEAKGLKLGAVDYIPRPFSPAVVLARIATHLKLSRQRRMLETHANIDGLTELPNRRHFETTLLEEWRRAKRRKSTLSVALLEVDSFAEYCDYHGRKEGDRVLLLVARAIASAMLRPGDLVARIDRDQFALILPHTDEKGMAHVCENVRKSVAGLGLPHPVSALAQLLTVSAGVATTIGDSIESPQALFSAAEADLRAVRETRRGVRAVPA